MGHQSKYSTCGVADSRNIAERSIGIKRPSALSRITLLISILDNHLVFLYESINSPLLGIKLPFTMPHRKVKAGNPLGESAYCTLPCLEPDPGIDEIS
ncbi:hypothetical protein ES703_113003 [subsurface metagenome]